MRRNRILALAMTALLLLTAGCGAGNTMTEAAAGAANNSPASSAGAASDYFESSGAEYWDGTMNTTQMEPTGAAGSGTGGSVYQNAGAKLIRRAELSIQTTEFEQTVQALNELVTDCGGYYESASVYGGSYRDAYAHRNGDYTVRVPAEQYTAFLSSAGELGYITSSTESSEDVGEQYYDTEARLKTQQTKQERLLALLEKAETMEDIIALESALSDVEYQIEQLSSTLNRYDALIGFSTIHIYLNEVAQITEEVGETAPLGERMAAGLAESVRNLVRGSQDFLVWTSYNIIFLVIVAAVAAVAVTAALRFLKKRRKAQEKPKE